MAGWDREHWRTVAERLLATDMGVDEWCAANHVSSSALYRRLAWFRDNEPELFGGREVARAGDGSKRWLEAVRAAARESLLPAAPAGRAPAQAAAARPSFVEVDLGPSRAPSREPIVVEVRGIVVRVPPGSAREDVEAVLSAAVAV